MTGESVVADPLWYSPHWFARGKQFATGMLGLVFNGSSTYWRLVQNQAVHISAARTLKRRASPLYGQ